VSKEVSSCSIAAFSDGFYGVFRQVAAIAAFAALADSELKQNVTT
jgi:hypothetical protein